MKKIVEKKTPGTLAVEKHRPLMNKLTNGQRQRRERMGACRVANYAAGLFPVGAGAFCCASFFVEWVELLNNFLKITVSPKQFPIFGGDLLIIR